MSFWNRDREKEIERQAHKAHTEALSATAIAKTSLKENRDVLDELIRRLNERVEESDD